MTPSGLTVVYGPPGSGRSTLVRSWLASGRLPTRHLWVQEADVRAKGFPQVPVGTGSVILTGDTLDDDPCRPAQVTRLLAAGIRVVTVTSRLPRFTEVLTDKVVAGPETLFWCADQVRTRARARGLDVAEEVVAQLVSATAGWPAVVTAFLNAYSPGTSVTSAGNGLRRAATVVRRELLPALATTTDFSTWAALTLEEAATPELFDALPGGREVLEDATDLGLTRWVEVDGRALVGLVPLVRNELRRQLLEQDPERLRDLHLRAAAWYAARGQAVGAFDQLRQSGDTLGLARLVADQWPELVAGGRRTELGAVVATLSGTEAGRPSPLRHLAEYFGHQQYGGAGLVAPPGPHDLDRLDGDLPERILRTAASATLTRFRVGELEDALRVVRDFGPLAGACVESPAHSSDFLSFWYALAGSAEQLNHQVPQAIGSYTRAWELRRSDLFGCSGRAAAFRAAALQRIGGDTESSRLWLERGRNAPEVPRSLSRLVDGPGAVAEHVAATDELRYDDAERIAAEHFTEEAVDELWVLRAWTRTRYLSVTGRHGEALLHIEDVQRYRARQLRGNGSPVALTRMIHAHALLGDGQLSRAESALAGMEDYPLAELVRVRARLSTNDFDAAYRIAETYERATRYMPRLTMSFALAGAAAAYGRGDRDEARARLHAVARRATDLGIPALLGEVPRGLLEAHADDRLIADLVERLDPVSSGHAYPEQASMVVLTEREKVVLDELAAGHTLKQIAALLSVSIHTVKSQTRAVYRKLDSGGRADAVLRARRLGLIPEPSTGPVRVRRQG